MRKFYVVSDRLDEISVIKDFKPNNILISYRQFKKKSLYEFILKLGYSPTVMVDPGAYTAFKKGFNINYEEYMTYVYDCITYYKHPLWEQIHNNANIIPTEMMQPLKLIYLSLDVVGDPQKTLEYYVTTVKYGYINAVPVFHYGSDISYLKRYISLGANYIALGGVVTAPNKQSIIKWVRDIIYKYQDINFHLLGCSNFCVLSQCQKLHSCDSSSWIRKAAFGTPKKIIIPGREGKIKRASINIRAEEYEFPKYEKFLDNRGHPML